MEPTLIVCKTCEELRPVEDYYTYKRPNRDYRAKTCRRCQQARTRAQAAAVVARRGSTSRKRPERLTEGGMSGRERRAFWATFKMRRGCADCGETDWRRLEFDHLPGFEKCFTIGEAVTQTGVYSDEEIAAEVAKCEVVCNPCHLRRTVSRARYGPEIREGM